MPATAGRRPTPIGTGLHFVTVVWGRAYLDKYLELALPSILAPGNLPAVLGRERARYSIYAPEAEAEIIRKSRLYRAASDLLRIEFCPLAAAETTYKHLVAARYQRQALERAACDGSALIALPPDAVWSDGTFERLTGAALRERPAVLLAGIRVRADSFVPALRAACPADADVWAASGRQLVRLALDHMHPISRALFWESPRTHSWPSHVYWQVGGEGFVARCFHLHPFLVNPRAVGTWPPGTTLDGDFLRGLADGGQAPYLVADSDEAMVCEVSDPDFSLGEIWRAGGLTAPAVANWARVLANRQHRRFFRERIRFHAGDLTPAWGRVEAESDRVVRRIEQWVRLLSILRWYDEPLKRLRRRLRPWKARWGLR